MKKIGKMNEMAWLLGNVLCALGVSLCTKASFGLSMLAAPPYILHIVISKFLPWYSQGISEYAWQIMIMLLMCLLVKKFSPKYLLSFVTVIFFGALIDMWLGFMGGNAALENIYLRIGAFIIGELIVSLSVAFYFRTSYALQVAECLVMEVSRKFNRNPEKIKLINDVGFATLSVVMALAFTHSFTGVGVGTIVIAVVNAPLIKMWGKLLDKIFTFETAFPKLFAQYGKLARQD